MADSKTKGLDLSIILTAHNEGILAHKTMLSVFRSTKHLDDNGISYEIIIHIDNGDEETKKYFSRYSSDSRIRIFENKFGDPSQSRNFSVENAEGKFVGCFDADDLLSENWYLDAYNVAKDKKGNIARFNYIITFGGYNTVITENSDFGEQEILYFVESNLYGSPFVCSRDLYLKRMQRKNKPPYSYEDWQWNLDILSEGGNNVVVPGSIIFYRQNPLVKTHVLNQHNSVRSTLSPTKMLSYEYLKSRTDLDKYLDTSQGGQVKFAHARKWTREIAYHTLVFANNYRLFRGVKRALRLRKPKKLVLPEWIIDEWKSINKIEKLTGPSVYTMKNLISWLPNKDVGIGYVKINRQLKSKPDTLFFIPWLIRGGADKVFINAANEISIANPEWSVAVFQDYPVQSLWQNKLNENISFVDMANIMSNVDYESQIRMMAMFVSQHSIKRIIIGNSRFAYDFVLRYKALIKHLDIKVYAYAFAGITDSDGIVSGYVHEELPLVQDVIYRVVTDNHEVSKSINSEHAIDADKFFTHHQFLDNEFKEPKHEDKEKLKILWASRVARSKLPEVAKSIAKGLDSTKYQIDVYGSIEDGYTESLFMNSNLNYRGGFDGIDSLPTDEYDVFLYTSNADGMPNMLLEVGSKGLPIVAPNIGGIKDFIKDGETGLMVDDCYDVEAYIAAIKKLSDPKLRMKLAKNAQKLLNSEFSKSNWEDGIRKIFDK